MNKLFENIIDYGLIESYYIEKLRDSLIIPIKKEGIYLNCFVCEETKLELFNSDLLLKKIKITKSEIDFFLDDIENRIKLYKLTLSCINSKDLDFRYIEEFVFILLQKAIDLRCSDIHIENLERVICIRFRIDGILKVFYIFDKNLSKVISSYLKMKSNLDITQFRLPLDGAFSFFIKNEKYDFRISTMPTIFGESIVIRVLDNKKVKRDLKTLGFTKDIFEQMKQILKLNQGLVLISGPTGSGKTTTLYSLIEILNTQSRKIVTIEDPVEYKIEQIQQINIQEEIGLSFDKVLKNILRQDPDVILIGEVRDAYSLQIALQASLTGHLVLASIHANNSLETLFRLMDLDANKYLLSSTLKYVISQRLVLKLCKFCKGMGCSDCNFTGFLGRCSIAEVLKIDTNLSSMILKQSGINKMKEYLTKIEYKDMLSNGEEIIKEGKTTLKEVYKVL